MESRSNVIAAGLFVIALTLGLIGAAVWLSAEALDRVNYLVVAKIPVSGLHAKAAVRLRGVEVGKVDTIAFDAHDPSQILVGISVDRTAPLTLGTYGQLGYTGVTGLSFIALDDDGSNPQRLPAGGAEAARIELRPSMLDQIGGSGQDLLREASLAARRLNQMLSDDNLAHLSRALRGTEYAVQQIGTLAADLQPAARSLAALEASTSDTLSRLDLLAGDLRTATASFGQHLEALDALGQGARQVGEASQALATTMVGDTLPRIAGAVDDLSRTSRSLDRVLGQIEQRPQSLVFGRAAPVPGPGEPGFAAPARSR